jgi:serine/threonine protein kinase
VTATAPQGGAAPESAEACPDENVLVSLAEGSIDGEDRRAIDRHLDGCAECSKLVAHLAKLAVPEWRDAGAVNVRSGPTERYKIVRQLGQGAMGVVWEAEDTNLGRRVALKFVRPEGANKQSLRRRLLREARALAQIRHVNVVQVFDAGEADDEVCLVLELVDGTNARAWREAAPRTLDETLAVWRQAAAGLAAVHRAGIVHRDIKPDNVLVAADGRVLVGDFGLATGDLGVTTTTVSGAVIGTPLYMAPEQLAEAPATAKSDQFALCASIWEAVVGERPFRGATIAAIVLAMSRPPVMPAMTGRSRAEVRTLEVLARGLDPNPARRYPDIDALLAALADPAPSTNRSSLILAAIGAAVFVALAVIVAISLSR